MIHPTAIIGDNVILGDNVSIGAFCVVDGDITIGDNTTLYSHVVICGHTKIGTDCKIFPFAVIGVQPQDLKYDDEPSRVEIGNHTTIREHATVHAGTKGGGMVTKVANGCLLMVATHVAHDCVIGDNVIMANNATLAGHVQVGDNVVIGGLAAVHQFVRIGNNAMIGGLSGVEQDVLPYSTVMGERASMAGLNLIGLKRRGFKRSSIQNIQLLMKHLFETDQPLQSAIETVPDDIQLDDGVQQVLAFIAQSGKRGLCQPK